MPLSYMAELVQGLRSTWAAPPNFDLTAEVAQTRILFAAIHMGKSATAIERDDNPSELGGVNREISADKERRVIDLAAERAMREARAAACGQVDDIRPDRSQDFSVSQTALEAAQQREAPAAPSHLKHQTPAPRSASARRRRYFGKNDRHPKRHV